MPAADISTGTGNHETFQKHKYNTVPVITEM